MYVSTFILYLDLGFGGDYLVFENLVACWRIARFFKVVRILKHDTV